MAIIDGRAVDQFSKRQDHAQNIAATYRHGNFYWTAYEPIIAKIARNAVNVGAVQKELSIFQNKTCVRERRFPDVLFMGYDHVAAV